MKRYAGKHVYTLRKKDIGKIALRDEYPTKYGPARKHIPLSSFLGVVQAQDVGKWIIWHQRAGLFSVESNEQMAERMAGR